MTDPIRIRLYTLDGTEHTHQREGDFNDFLRELHTWHDKASASEHVWLEGDDNDWVRFDRVIRMRLEP